MLSTGSIWDHIILAWVVSVDRGTDICTVFWHKVFGFRNIDVKKIVTTNEKCQLFENMFK